MRGKRSKQYRKLMQQYGLSFGFREPYQVLVDADIIRDADRFKMDLLGGLERTLHGQVKPMITQCSMRHLYEAAKLPDAKELGISYLIDKAKTYERRRCGHKPEDYPDPLSTQECLASVVDPKDNKTNKHCYVIATQDLEVRKQMRGILGVPLVYINRSVMIMEPMAEYSELKREREERAKFRDGLKNLNGPKRKREEDEDEDGRTGEPAGSRTQKKTYTGKAKGPNPLSVKKAKKKPEGRNAGSKTPKENKELAQTSQPSAGGAETDVDGLEPAAKKKRKRKHKAKVGGEATAMSDEAGDDE